MYLTFFGIYRIARHRKSNIYQRTFESLYSARLPIITMFYGQKIRSFIEINYIIYMYFLVFELKQMVINLCSYGRTWYWLTICCCTGIPKCESINKNGCWLFRVGWDQWCSYSRGFSTVVSVHLFSAFTLKTLNKPF